MFVKCLEVTVAAVRHGSSIPILYTRYKHSYYNILTMLYYIKEMQIAVCTIIIIIRYEMYPLYGHIMHDDIIFYFDFFNPELLLY